ncbi:hypothetical protein [Burkholderia glumae]|uniref:hypothetical protein n=1 Tax=Burkholderia glumae TaxID=337 RepID=UPI0011D25B72|nr:hypothetical protein [Burkholderia glumae]
MPPARASAADLPALGAHRGGDGPAQEAVSPAAGQAMPDAPAAALAAGRGDHRQARALDQAAAADPARDASYAAAAAAPAATGKAAASATPARQAGAPAALDALGAHVAPRQDLPAPAPERPASAVAVPEPAASIDVVEVAAAVQETVAGLAAGTGEAAASAPARPARSGARRHAGRNVEPAGAPARRRKAGASADEVRPLAAAPSVPAAPAPADAMPPDAAGGGMPAAAEPAPPAVDSDAPQRALADRVRALQIETVDLRRAANGEMRRVNRLLLALAVVVLAGIAALVVQALALSNARGEAAALRQRVDRLVSLQETQQADLAAMQQRNEALGAQVQRLTNRGTIAAPRQPVSAPVRHERRRR